MTASSDNALRLVVDPSAAPDPAGLARAAGFLRAGHIVAIPTDTLYGLAVDPRNAGAVARLIQVKRRPPGQPIPLIACDEHQVEAYVGPLGPLGRRIAAAFWPGPLSLIVPASAELVGEVHGGTGRVAVRVPSHRIARELARAVGCPLTATSANQSGLPAAATADDVLAALPRGALAAVLDAGPTPGGPPSTMIDITGAAPKLVRAGVVPWARVLEFLAGG